MGEVKVEQRERKGESGSEMKVNLVAFFRFPLVCIGSHTSLLSFFLSPSFFSVSEDLFSLFDENGDGSIDFPEMVQGVAGCCRRVMKEKAECEAPLYLLQHSIVASVILHQLFVRCSTLLSTLNSFPSPFYLHLLACFFISCFVFSPVISVSSLVLSHSVLQVI